MSTIREQFDTMCERAAITSRFSGIEVDIVLVRHRNKDPSRISILGSAINRVMADIWRANGSQVRLLCHYDSSGNRTKPKRNLNENI